jgi:hypothetical protein
MSTLISILGLIPNLIKAVQAAEEFAPLAGNGKAKLDLVLGVISDVYADAQKIVPQITAVIARIVAFANALGIFKTTTTAATPTA